MTVEPPSRNHFGEMTWTAANIAAAAADAAGTCGIATSLVALLRFSVDDPNQLQEAQWREIVSDLLNTMEDRLAALEGQGTRVQLTPVASLVAVYCAKEAKPELSAAFSRKQIEADFPGMNLSELDEAIFELSDFGMIDIEGAVGIPYLEFRLERNLFLFLDPIVHGWIPQADAVALGCLMAKDASLEQTARLEAHLRSYDGWSRRRMNAALLYLRDFVFEPGHVGSSIQPDYPTTEFQPQAQERSRIKRLAAELERQGIDVPSL